MHGPVTAPPPHRPPQQRTVVLLRVVFVALAVLSLGFLAWLTLLRAAIVQRRPLGWWVLAADLALLVVSVILGGGQEDENSWQTNTSVALVLLQMGAAVAYYLVVDVRAHRVTPGWPVYGPPGAVPGGPAYAPHPPHPYAGFPPQPLQQLSHPHPQGHLYEQQPQPAPYGGQPQRIDRVRAELDELSDYLRKEEGR
ncbi:hypothetical protein [Streptomyces sp. NPDC007100]|uniref:hypothetical protein n=1 Tax=Streptomyces sp. NPDC007100 TaxID=3155602 RepID=UPI0033D8201E